MKPAHSQKKIAAPYTWVQLSNGERISESIQMRLDEWSPKLFGYHMLKLGGLSCELATHMCNIQHQVRVDDSNPLHNVIANSYQLPFLEKSFDAVILAHQLDYCDDPHRLLREVDRVMMDDGYLVISGFNPISLLGLSSFLPWRKKNLPWSGRMFTPSRVKDWLGVLNYEIVDCDCYGLFPMTRYLTLGMWVENLFGHWGSSFGSTYFIVARKRTYPLKPIKPHWKLKRSLSPMSVNYRVSKSTPFKALKK
ncbi:SAM-dependent methyltransferase [Vibrio sp. 10N.286.49.B3]|uniref:class I SAM-dependent methyltransferase n=1 Tax=Vibrio sp. 10N.286.49.B3 TaxID=1880855 RepID=UPI000C84FB3A|nr:class I SAM-dependent methyltransferase [Vibrio sp. 10N.286.49.B3]PMH41079.1 SAM-dependent methyltransferase [Vibrio sp. 10N.286.49.B3]